RAALPSPHPPSPPPGRGSLSRAILQPLSPSVGPPARFPPCSLPVTARPPGLREMWGSHRLPGLAIPWGDGSGGWSFSRQADGETVVTSLLPYRHADRVRCRTRHPDDSRVAKGPSCVFLL